MRIEVFTSRRKVRSAIDNANSRIEELAKIGFKVNQISQSESSYYDTSTKTSEFHFTLTVLFHEIKDTEKDSQKDMVHPRVII